MPVKRSSSSLMTERRLSEVLSKLRLRKNRKIPAGLSEEDIGGNHRELEIQSKQLKDISNQWKMFVHKQFSVIALRMDLQDKMLNFIHDNWSVRPSFETHIEQVKLSHEYYKTELEKIVMEPFKEYFAKMKDLSAKVDKFEKSSVEYDRARRKNADAVLYTDPKVDPILDHERMSLEISAEIKSVYHFGITTYIDWGRNFIEAEDKYLASMKQNVNFGDDLLRNMQAMQDRAATSWPKESLLTNGRNFMSSDSDLPALNQFCEHEIGVGYNSVEDASARNHVNGSHFNKDVGLASTYFRAWHAKSKLNSNNNSFSNMSMSDPPSVASNEPSSSAVECDLPNNIYDPLDQMPTDTSSTSYGVVANGTVKQHAPVTFQIGNHKSGIRVHEGVVKKPKTDGANFLSPKDKRSRSRNQPQISAGDHDYNGHQETFPHYATLNKQKIDKVEEKDNHCYSRLSVQNLRLSPQETADRVKAPPFKVVASYAYTSQQEDEINLTRGEALLVLPWNNDKEREDGWFFGEKLSSRERGLFPANYCTLATDS